MDKKDLTFEQLRNECEQKAAASFPGYRPVVYGTFTEGKPYSEAFEWRTQVEVEGGQAYWLDVKEGSVLPGDKIVIMERMATLKVIRIGVTLKAAYFDKPDPVKHKFGTLIELHRFTN